MIDKVIKSTSLPQENVYKDKITSLRHKNLMLIEKVKHLEEADKNIKRKCQRFAHKKSQSLLSKSNKY